MSIFYRNKQVDSSLDKVQQGIDTLSLASKNTVQLASAVTNKLKNLELDFSKQIEKIGDMISDALIMCNDAGVITFANKEAYDIFGYDYNIKELLNVEYVSLFDTNFGIEELCKNASLKDPFPYSDIKAKTKDGELISVSLSLSKIIISNGDDYYISIIRKF